MMYSNMARQPLNLSAKDFQQPGAFLQIQEGFHQLLRLGKCLTGTMHAINRRPTVFLLMHIAPPRICCLPRTLLLLECDYHLWFHRNLKSHSGISICLTHLSRSPSVQDRRVLLLSSEALRTAASIPTKGSHLSPMALKDVVFKLDDLLQIRQELILPLGTSILLLHL